MSDAPQGPGWWQASDGKWYAPELHPDAQAAPPAAPPTTPTPAAPAPFGSAPDGTPFPAATPATPPPGEGGGKGKVVLVVVLLLVVAVIGAGLAFALTSGGDDEKADPTTTTAAEDRDPPVTRTLLPRSTTTLDDGPATTLPLDDLGLGGLEDDLDPEVALCVGTEVLADPELADLLAAPDLDPNDPAVQALFAVLLDCGGRPYLEEAFVSELSADQAACATDVFATLDDATFSEILLVLTRIGLAGDAAEPTAEELAIMDPLLPCII